LEHVQCFPSSYLTDHDAVGAHAEGVSHQVSDGDLALPLDVGRPGLQPDDVRLLKSQLRGVLDRDDALVFGKEG
jgi:hypothetical protein